MREVSAIQMEWVEECAPKGYYFDRRKQMAEEK
jgi:hypothetical protein